MTVVMLAVLEAMDKEAGPPVLWALSLGLGAIGYLGARWRRWTAVISLAALGAALAPALSEVLDPLIGPAIRAETHGWYLAHLVAAAVVGAVMITVGAGRERPPR